MLNDVLKDYEVSVGCAHCSGGMLHQEQVEIYRVEDEDSPVQKRVVCDRSNNVLIDKNAPRSHSRNPSPRRDGVRIVFNCENCGGFTNLLIFQHKGRELLQICKDGELLNNYAKV